MNIEDKIRLLLKKQRELIEQKYVNGYENLEIQARIDLVNEEIAKAVAELRGKR